ncbi:deazaflavin-dependent oxidoreductase, nitroreductase family [Blastococcus aurantiacus]|uniref:Deazaflavin-dependent oxidoreductase, nitroreductase family n=1 Tax=Blastococcus aurantiacus TaxID=1550231 RepID=A0A1G7H9N0_9ACTN|nr:nitroreductase family deazaflavin-dependent oxidoreductase [Blastococcus aurantiacus]SDE97132.1 deazaflavin-dependent oxidoreductase, nitroreductase family [Blastococcus aurantiacus]
MALLGEYEPSTVPWVREEVEHLERTGEGLRGRSVVLLTTVGARSGLLRKTPLMRVSHAGVYAAVASTRGGDRHPHWYGNALAHPKVELRDGDQVLSLVAREITGVERAGWWSRACTVFPSYVEYQRRTSRRIPVLLLEPASPAPEPGRA